MVKKANIIQLNNLSGGMGEAEMHFICSSEELCNHARTYAKIVLKPGSSIGWHQHKGEVESYYILSGTGVFIDNDKTRTEIGPGDVCSVLSGQCHSIENTSTKEKLIFIALIICI